MPGEGQIRQMGSVVVDCRPGLRGAHPAALQPRHLKADLRAGAGAADEDEGAASAEVYRRLIRMVTEAQITRGEDGFGTRLGAFKVD